MANLYEVQIETENDEGEISTAHHYVSAPNFKAVVDEYYTDMQDEGMEVVAIKKHVPIARTLPGN